MFYQLSVAGIVPMHVMDNKSFIENVSQCIEMIDLEGEQICKAKGLIREY